MRANASVRIGRLRAAWRRALCSELRRRRAHGTRSSTIASLRLLEMSIANSRSIRSALCCSGCV
eukprot:4425763-Prymnesium_polylepis.1